MTKKKSLIASAIVFVICLGLGFWIARHKPLWNDEQFSLISSINKATFTAQWQGKISEGNNTPLYYSLQKVLNKIIAYQIPLPWVEDNWGYRDSFSEIFLRIIPVICMSLSVALVFYFFAAQYTFWVGCLSFLIYLSSYMIWVYWAEARPYALIVLLSSVQSLLIIKLLEAKEILRGWIRALSILHVLMSVTFIFSIGQIVAASFLLFLRGHRRYVDYVALTLVPAVIVLYYYILAPHYPFYFSLSAEQLIRDSISRERFYFCFAMLVGLALVWYTLRIKKVIKVNFVEMSKPRYYIFFLALMLVFTGLVLFIFHLKQTPGNGFPISSRYFIYLMPIGVIAGTWSLVALFRSFKDYRLIQVLIFIAAAVLLAQRFLKVVPSAIRSILGG